MGPQGKPPGGGNVWVEATQSGQSGMDETETIRDIWEDGKARSRSHKSYDNRANPNDLEVRESKMETLSGAGVRQGRRDNLHVSVSI